MSAPQVSVIVPVHNAAGHLEALLASLAAQAQPELEFLLVDDGSQDGSLAMLQAFAIQEPRARVLHHPQAKGSAAARNTAIAAAQGEYLGFADADDICMPDQYQRLYLLAKDQRLDVAYCNAYCFQQQPGDSTQLVCSKRKLDGVRPGRDWLIHGWRVGERLSATWLSLVRRELVIAGGLRFPDGEIMDDELWTPALMLRAERVAWLPEPLYYYRNHLDSITQTRQPEKVMRRLQSLCRVADRLFQLAAQQQGELASAIRWHAYLNGDAALGLLKRLPIKHGRREAYVSLRESGVLDKLWRQAPTFRLAKRLLRESVIARFA